MCPACAQVRDRKARQAASSLRQPMLHSAYSEPPQWTPARLTRIVIITFLSGVIAGMALLTRSHASKSAQHIALLSYLMSSGGSACRHHRSMPTFDDGCTGVAQQNDEDVMSLHCIHSQCAVKGAGAVRLRHA